MTKMQINALVMVSAGLLFYFSAVNAGGLVYPKTPKRPVTDLYHGVEVTDPYRWMEEKESVEFKQWLESQGRFAQQVLETIPGRKALEQRILALTTEELRAKNLQLVGEDLFYLQRAPGESSYSLVVMDRSNGKRRSIINPDIFNEGKNHASIDWFKVSPDANLVVMGISKGGSENSVLRIFDIEKGTLLDESIDRTGFNEAVSVNWLAGNRSFIYNRALAESGREKLQIRLHRIGRDPEMDRAVWGYGVRPEIAIDKKDISYFLLQPDSPYVVATIVSGVSKNRRFYSTRFEDVITGEAKWHELADMGDQWLRGNLHKNDFYVISQKATTYNKMLRVDLQHPENKPMLVLPPGEALIEEVVVAKDALYIKGMQAGIDKLYHMSYDSEVTEEIELPFDGQIDLYNFVADPLAEGVIFEMEGWLQSSKIYRYDSRGLSDTGVIPPPPVDFSSIRITREVAVGDDGVRVPITILHRDDIKMDGQNPTILSGYGAYGFAAKPRFDAGRLAWLERGGIYTVAHVRGGGEFGNAWEKDGKILTKSNTILDFVACAEHLIEKGYTNPGKLAGVGRSAGGITIGGAITERPDLFAVANHGVGMADLLRAETDVNGAANVPEFGTVKKKYQFIAMHSVSPYHRVRDGEKYPAVILTTGANDPRVAPWHPGKFAARLQDASSSARPVLLRVDRDAGHGHHSTLEQEVSLRADIWSFFLWQMGEPEFQPVGSKL